MRSHIRRSLFVCCSALVVALAAYAGQTGYPDDLAVRHVGQLPEIRNLELDGIKLQYRMGVVPQGEVSPVNGHGQTPQIRPLELFISLTEASSGKRVEDAQIYLTAVTPRGNEIIAIGQKMAWGYRTSLDAPWPGRYELEVVAKAGDRYFIDRFCQDNE